MHSTWMAPSIDIMSSHVVLIPNYASAALCLIPVWCMTINSKPNRTSRPRLTLLVEAVRVEIPFRAS